MPQTYEEILNNSRAALNDQDADNFTNQVLLAYLNMARFELQEIFEFNNIPVTNATSTVINVPAGTTAITFAPDPPIVGVDYLPDDLVEIRELFSSPEDQAQWVRVDKKEYLTSEELDSDAELSFISVWTWMEQEIRILSCNQDNDIKIDYIKSLFVSLVIGDIGDDNNILNTDTFLAYRTAGLAAEFIDENDTRAFKNNSYALMALDRSLGISTKGKQSIVSRRRPFRASFKRRGILI